MIMIGRANNPIWQERYVEVMYERGHIEFFERMFAASDVCKLVIVSPWIVTGRDDHINIDVILDHIERYQVETTIVMRNPQKEPANFEAVDLFKRRISPWMTLYYNNSVHAKIYVCRCEPFGFALLSSANFMARDPRSYEVGLLISGFGAGQKVIEELELTGTDYIPGKSESCLEWAPWFRR